MMVTKKISKVYNIDREKSTKEIIDEDRDYIDECIGSFGRWQATICFIAASTRLLAMWNIFSIIFLTPATDFSCAQFTETSLKHSINNNTSSVCYEDCSQYEYVNNIFNKTLISEFDLVCEDAWLASFTQTVLMFGVLLGVFLFGWISDRCVLKKSYLQS